MKSSKLISALSHLSPKECKRFEAFIHSPFFNKNKRIQCLLQQLLKYSPAFEHPKLSKEELHAHCFVGSAYDEYQINNLFSALLQLLYRFLAQLQLEQDAPKEKEWLIAALLEREMHTHIPAQAKRLEKLLAKNGKQSFQHFQQQYQLSDYLDRFFLTQGNRGFDPHLQTKSDQLDRHYICNKLRIACDMVSRNTVVNASYECHFLEDLQLAMEQEGLAVQEEPAIQIYQSCLQMLQIGATDDAYFQLKELLKQHLSIFPQEELRVLYNFALNFCVKRINSGNTRFYQEVLEVYRVLLEEKIILKNGYLTQWSFINIVTAGIRLQDYGWTEAFIHEHKSYLLPDQQANVSAYSLSSLHFEKEQYAAALQTLQGVEFTDAFYHMAAKIIQLKSYYILEEDEALLALIEASKKYLRRNKRLSTYQIQSNSHFVKLLLQLYQLRVRQHILTKAKFLQQWKAYGQQLETLQPVSNKDWLWQEYRALPN